MPLRPVLRSAVLTLAVALSVACGHAQQNGRYAFTAEEILADTCALVPSSEGLWDGELVIDDEIVRMRYDLYESELRGRYQESSDSFYVDGTASNMPGTANGVACTFELVQIHVEGTDDGPNGTAFRGVVRVQTRSLADDRCECRVEATYRAQRAP